MHLVAQTEAAEVETMVAQKLCLVPLMVPQYPAWLVVLHSCLVFLLIPQNPSQLVALAQAPVGLAHNFVMVAQTTVSVLVAQKRCLVPLVLQYPSFLVASVPRPQSVTHSAGICSAANPPSQHRSSLSTHSL